MAVGLHCEGLGLVARVAKLSPELRTVRGAPSPARGGLSGPKMTHSVPHAGSSGGGLGSLP